MSFKNPRKKILSVNVTPALFSLLEFSTLEDGTSGLFRSIDKEFSSYAMSYLRRVEI
jgi:hypothetical protein